MAWNELGMSAASSAIGAGLGLALQPQADRRQIRQQAKLTAQQVAAQKELGKFNQGLALDTWEKTNYAEQRKQLQKAGLNVGLMYEGGGAGGTTQGGSAGSVTGGQAPTGGGEIQAGMGMGMQIALMQAQIENIKADTKKKGAETPAVEASTSETMGRIEKLKQETQNAAVQGAIMGYDQEIKKIEMQLQRESYDDAIAGIKRANDKLYGEAQSALAKGEIDQNTKDTIETQIRNAAEEQLLRIAATKLGLVKTGADIRAVEKGIQKMHTDITTSLAANQRDWSRLTIQEKELIVKQVMAKNAETMTEFNTSTPEQIRQWTNILTDFIPLTGRKN